MDECFIGSRGRNFRVTGLDFASENETCQLKSHLGFSSQVVQPPTDGISSLNFSPKANYLVATSWDNQVLEQETMPV